MADQRSRDAAFREINRLRAKTLHRLVGFGRNLDQIVRKSGMELSAIFSRAASEGISLGISPVMAELVVRLYRRAPSWADGPDQIQLPAPADLGDLVELVEVQCLRDSVAGLGIRLGGDEDEEEGQGQ
jgi:hypothetical protein